MTDNIMEQTPLEFWYTNYRGEYSQRRVLPVHVRFGSTEHHPEPQWLMEAFDLDKDAMRVFAMKDMDRQVTPVAVPNNCRQRLMTEGKPYPKSSCAVCGQFSPKWRECDTLLAAAPALLSSAQIADCRPVPVNLIRESVRGQLKEPFCPHCGRSREAMDKLSELLPKESSHE